MEEALDLSSDRLLNNNNNDDNLSLKVCLKHYQLTCEAYEYVPAQEQMLHCS